jgi:hypothetical protein
MIPSKSDPRWAEIVKNPDAYKTKVSSIATKLMLGTVKIRAQTASVEESIEHVYSYFTKNESALADDIAALFK